MKIEWIIEIWFNMIQIGFQVNVSYIGIIIELIRFWNWNLLDNWITGLIWLKMICKILLYHSGVRMIL